MAGVAEAEKSGGAGPTLLRRLGWGHRGFRADSRWSARIGLLLVLLIPFVVQQWTFQRAIADPDLNPDLEFWLQNARVLFADPAQPFYARHPFYVYPPFFLTLLHPLSGLTVPLAAFIFNTLKWVALFVSCRLAWRLCAPPQEDVPPIVALGSLLLTARFIENDLSIGNINLFLLLAILGGTWLVSRGRQVAGGAVVAAAACVKVAPALVLVYFACKGWWRTLLGAALGAAVCLFIWPALLLGWENNWHLLLGWYDAVVAGFIERGAVRSEHTNQALVGVLNRLFGPYPAFLPDGYLTIVALPDAVRTFIRVAVSGAVLVGLAWLLRRPVHCRRQPLSFSAELSLVLVALLLLSGLSWKAHFVLLLLPYSVVLAFLADARQPAVHRGRIAGLLLASFTLCSLTSDIITPAGADYAEAFGLIMLGAIALALAVARIRLDLARRGDLSLSCAPSAARSTRRRSGPEGDAGWPQQ